MEEISFGAIQQFEEYKTSKKKLDEHLDWIVGWLEEYPHLSLAQIKDWLLEQLPSLEIGDSTVRKNSCRLIGEKQSRKP